MMFRVLSKPNPSSSSTPSSSCSSQLGIFLERIETPCPLLRLSHGAPMYSTNGLVEELPASHFLGQLDLSDTLSRPAKPGTSISELYRCSEKQITVMSARSMENGITSTNAQGLCVNALSGRKTVIHAEFMRRVALEKPRLVVAMADEVPFSSRYQAFFSLLFVRPRLLLCSVYLSGISTSILLQPPSHTKFDAKHLMILSIEQSVLTVITSPYTSVAFSVVINALITIPKLSSSKRRGKAEERSTQWFRELRNYSGPERIDWERTFLFGVVQGSADLSRVKALTRQRVGEGASGIAVGGSGMG